MIGTQTKTTAEWIELINRINEGRFQASTGRQQRSAPALGSELAAWLDYDAPLDQEQGIDISRVADDLDLDEWDIALTFAQAGGGLPTFA